MQLTPVLTEKSLGEAKEGKYTFWVDVGLNKYQIKNLVESAFSVHVTGVWVVKKGGSFSKNYRRTKIELPRKKAVVTLKDKEKIDLFEEVSKK
ncbi:50S ribosomal protein L23 [Candidatus Woesebacteria bacterium GWB1_43_5]|uniref:50S ribosomal protein L23 n=1 Tax=Candidatus Woesebacteria bacterium GWB1_43_5 TaxID=1802474 RepID=A0A1F7WT85_9BACT|nr:MAG: 50S ribosomal protein L23 [Candidatus Woesebacteria bacterium GWB1_43_5]